MQMVKSNLNDPIPVTAAIILKDDQVFIAQRKSTDRLAGLWEFPGGKIESAESPEECLQRELKEELGIDTRIGEYLGESIYRYPHGAIRLMAYRVFWVGGTLRPIDHARCKWVQIKKLPDFSFAAADKPFVAMLLKNRHKSHSVK